jgi:hypothetical protein
VIELIGQITKQWKDFAFGGTVATLIILAANWANASLREDLRDGVGQWIRGEKPNIDVKVNSVTLYRLIYFSESLRVRWAGWFVTACLAVWFAVKWVPISTEAVAYVRGVKVDARLFTFAVSIVALTVVAAVVHSAIGFLRRLGEREGASPSFNEATRDFIARFGPLSILALCMWIGFSVEDYESRQLLDLPFRSWPDLYLASRLCGAGLIFVCLPAIFFGAAMLVRVGLKGAARGGLLARWMARYLSHKRTTEEPIKVLGELTGVAVFACFVAATLISNSFHHQ